MIWTRISCLCKPTYNLLDYDDFNWILNLITFQLLSYHFAVAAILMQAIFFINGKIKHKPLCKNNCSVLNHVKISLKFPICLKVMDRRGFWINYLRKRRIWSISIFKILLKIHHHIESFSGHYSSRSSNQIKKILILIRAVSPLQTIFLDGYCLFNNLFFGTICRGLSC